MAETIIFGSLLVTTQCQEVFVPGTTQLVAWGANVPIHVLLLIIHIIYMAYKDFYNKWIYNLKNRKERLSFF